MKKWFDHKPASGISYYTSVFREILLSSYGFLGMCLLLHMSCYAQAQEKAPDNVTIISKANTSLTIRHFTGNTMSLRYATLPGNQSGQNRNSFWLWRASQVPWNVNPMKVQMLPADATESGSFVLDSISIAIYTSYIVCYSLDSNVKQICACSQLSATSDSVTNYSLDIQLLSVSADALVFRYKTLTGYLPMAYDNWFGVWKGSASPYNYYPPLATGKPTGNSNIDTATLNNVVFEPNQVYTLMYFVGKDTTNAAATITFLVK